MAMVAKSRWQGGKTEWKTNIILAGGANPRPKSDQSGDPKVACFFISKLCLVFNLFEISFNSSSNVVLKIDTNSSIIRNDSRRRSSKFASVFYIIIAY